MARCLTACRPVGDRGGTYVDESRTGSDKIPLCSSCDALRHEFSTHKGLDVLAQAVQRARESALRARRIDEAGLLPSFRLALIAGGLAIGFPVQRESRGADSMNGSVVQSGVAE